MVIILCSTNFILNCAGLQDLYISLSNAISITKNQDKLKIHCKFMERSSKASHNVIIYIVCYMHGKVYVLGLCNDVTFRPNYYKSQEEGD